MAMSALRLPVPAVTTVALLLQLFLHVLPGTHSGALPAGQAVADRQADGYSSSTGSIVAYRGVDTSRGIPLNVTAYVQLSGDPSSSSSSSSSWGDYWIVNSSFTGGSWLSTFVGYTSLDRTTLVYRWYTAVGVLSAGYGENKTVYIDAASGYCINYTLHMVNALDSGGFLGETYFANDTTTLYYTNSSSNSSTADGSNSKTYVYYNVDLRYINPNDPYNPQDQSMYVTVQSNMNTNRALNTTSTAQFNLGPHGPYPMLNTGYAVPLKNDNGELLSQLDAAPPPPSGKGSRLVCFDARGLTLVMLTLMTVALL